MWVRACRLLPERAAEEGQRAVPGLLRPDRIKLGPGDAARPDCRFVRERVVRKIAMELDVDVGRTELGLQCIDRFSREEFVLRRPVTENRNLDFRCVDVLERGAAVPHHPGRYLRDIT